jgi:hypothetical protein
MLLSQREDPVVLSTNNLRGIPRKSYGIDMATNALVERSACRCDRRTVCR